MNEETRIKELSISPYLKRVLDALSAYNSANDHKAQKPLPIMENDGIEEDFPRQGNI